MTGTCQISTCFVENLLLGVRVQEVQEVIRNLRITRVPLAPPQIAGLLNLRGQIVTAIDVRTCLNLEHGSQPYAPVNLILRTDAGPLSLLVDEVGAVLELGEEALEPPLPKISGFLRNIVQESYKLPGGLLLVLNTQRLLAELSALLASPVSISPAVDRAVAPFKEVPYESQSN
jgi:purine-binding chemotaxis protein CheW